MEYVAYIQAVNGVPIDDWAYTAYLGFKNRGTKIVLFEDIDKVPVSKYHFVIAFIEDTLKYLAKMNINAARGLNIPEELSSFTGRDISVMTLKEFIDNHPVPAFIKPHTEVKQFPSGVITSPTNKSLFLGGYDPDTIAQVSSVIDIVSEYRGFVIKGELKSLNRYMGDFRYYPDVSIIEKAVSMYKSAPSGYTIDFCVTKEGKTLLVECNDGWSIGSYGCDATIYTRLLVTRWLDLIK
jgi:hypothetical protein